MTEFYRFFRMPLALLLAAAILCSFCSCSLFYSEENLSEILEATDPSDGGEDPATSEKAFCLSYYTGESLDPFTSTSRTNSELLRLCYSGLFTVDNKYNAAPVLAESYEVEGNTVMIRIRSDICFSDGSPVTAADVESSYKRAGQKDSVWASAFSYIRSYGAVDNATIKVQFRSYTPSQLNLLDIPVVKAGSTDPAGYPVGCGRYRFSNEAELSLVRTCCNAIQGSYGLERISLLGIADREALIYNFNYGRLQAVCADLSLGANEYRSDSELVTVPTNRFTFLVVNRSRKELADVNFSKGITYLVDRTSLVHEALNSFAFPVWQPLNPFWSETKAADLNPEIFSLASASEAFTQAGFSLEGTQRTYKGKTVSLRILVNRENFSRVRAAEFIAQSLQMAGFEVEVVQATWDEYRDAVKNLDFDLYLGEVNLPANLDISALFSSAVCNTGEGEGTYDGLRAEAKALLTEGENVRTFVSNFQNSMPFIPLYYAVDALAVNMEVTGEFGESVTEFYAGIENWSFNLRS